MLRFMHPALAMVTFVALSIAMSAPTLAATLVTLKPTSGHPNLPVTVSGNGFGSSEAVDVYIDTVDTLLAVSSATGTITTTITMPGSAQPGSHYVTAIGRKSGDAAQAAFKVTTNWIESGFGAANLGWNQYENTLSSNVVPSLELSWGTSIGDVYAAPVVVGGKIYAGSSGSGTSNGLYALNATTGALYWHQTTAANDYFYGAPAVVDNVVYILGSTGNLYAFNAVNGTPLWLQPLVASGNSSPVVVNGVIYIGSGNTFYALKTDGTVLWHYATGATVGLSVAIGGGRVFVVSQDSNVYAFDAASGALLWTHATGGAIYGSPAVANGIVYAGSTDNKFYALRANSGQLIWSKATGAPIQGSPAVAGGLVYAASGDGNLYAYNAGNGGVEWSVPIASSSGKVSIADGVVYTGDNTGNVNAFDAVTGQYLVTAATGGSVYATPVIVNGALFVGSLDGHVYAFVPGGAGADAIRRNENAPPLSSLHADMQLVPSR